MADIAYILKVGGPPTAMLVASASGAINDFSVPLLGVPLTVITMSAAGAMCAFAWPKAEASRAKLFAVTIASTFVGAACVSVIPQLFGRDWPRELQGPLAFLFGLLAPWVVPAVRTAVPSFVKGLGNMIIRMVGGKVAAVQDDNEFPTYVPNSPKPKTPNEDQGD